MRGIQLALTVAVMMASAASAQDAPADPAKKEKKICQVERMTGSRTRTTKICMTREQWDRLRHDTKRDVEDLQRNSGAIPRTSGGGGASAVAG